MVFLYKGSERRRQAGLSRQLHFYSEFYRREAEKVKYVSGNIADKEVVRLRREAAL
jgi:hypothetical protein